MKSLQKNTSSIGSLIWLDFDKIWASLYFTINIPYILFIGLLGNPSNNIPDFFKVFTHEGNNVPILVKTKQNHQVTVSSFQTLTDINTNLQFEPQVPFGLSFLCLTVSRHPSLTFLTGKFALGI